LSADAASHRRAAVLQRIFDVILRTNVICGKAMAPADLRSAAVRTALKFDYRFDSHQKHTFVPSQPH
jgi:hypothetical protein